MLLMAAVGIGDSQSSIPAFYNVRGEVTERTLTRFSVLCELAIVRGCLGLLSLTSLTRPVSLPAPVARARQPSDQIEAFDEWYPGLCQLCWNNCEQDENGNSELHGNLPG